MSLRDLERDLERRLINLGMRLVAIRGATEAEWHRCLHPYFTGHVRRVPWLRRVAERLVRR